MTAPPCSRVLGVVLLVLALAGCDSSDADRGEPEGGASAGATASARAADPLAGPEEVPTDQFTDALSQALGRLSTAKIEVHVREATHAVLEAEGEVDYTADPPAAAVAILDADLERQVDVRLVGGVLYARDRGRPWQTLSADQGAAITGHLTALRSLSSVTQGITEVVYDEHERDGETWSFYTTRVDPRVFSANFSGDARADLESRDSVDVRWTLDEAGDVREVELDLGQDLGSATYLFKDWGTDVDIQAPPVST